VGRDFDEEKLKENPRRPLKDLNWIRQDVRLELGPRKKELLLTQLKKDVELLASLNIMDYSLLLGIHYVQRGNAENIRSTTLSVYQPRAGLTRTLSKRKQLEALFSTEPRRLSVSTGAPVLPSKEFLERTYGAFTSEQGGFYATNSKDETTGDIIYYFGVIDLLTTVLHLVFPANDSMG
jgi:1-phosphatidylinositol-4-phosphate 5-kinase